MMSFKSLYTGGQHVVVFSFDSEQEQNCWCQQVSAIKNSIAAINRDTNPGAGRSLRYQEWLDLVYIFIEQHGQAKLPPDVKVAVNSVEVGIGNPQTTWH